MIYLMFLLQYIERVYLVVGKDNKVEFVIQLSLKIRLYQGSILRLIFMRKKTVILYAMKVLQEELIYEFLMAYLDHLK